MKIRKSYLSIALMALTVQTGMAQEYEINAGYPMPGATIMAGFNLSF